jgi:Flp pilus assembly protein TadD
LPWRRSKSKKYYNNIGVLYAKEGKFLEAKRSFLRALQLKPDYIGAENNLVMLLTERGDFHGAMGRLQGVLNRFPDDERTRKNLQVVMKIRLDCKTN